MIYETIWLWDNMIYDYECNGASFLVNICNHFLHLYRFILIKNLLFLFISLFQKKDLFSEKRSFISEKRSFIAEKNCFSRLKIINLQKNDLIFFWNILKISKYAYYLILSTVSFCCKYYFFLLGGEGNQINKSVGNFSWWLICKFRWDVVIY